MYRNKLTMGVTLRDLNELERELVANIEKFDAPEKVRKRVARLVASKISLYRALVFAGQVIEKEKRSRGWQSE